MLMYQKIAWYLSSRPDIATFSLGKEKCRLIKKWFTLMDTEWYSYGCTPLSLDLLEEFAPVYSACIIEKTNPSIADLVSIYAPRIGKDDIFFAYVRGSSWTLLAWAIFISKILHDKRTLVLWFRSAISSFSYQKLHLGYYIESLFFECGLDLGVEQFSRGRDKNGYGFFWSSIGLCLHKIQLHFHPVVANASPLLDVDVSTITRSCLFFVDPDDLGNFNAVCIFLLSSEQAKYLDTIHVLEKRWFSISVTIL